MKLKRFFYLSVGLMSGLILLSSCVTPVPYTSEQQKEDVQIKEQIRKSFNAEKLTFLDHVDIIVFQGAVILGGLVFDAVDREVAVHDASMVKGVKSISNQIEVESNYY